MLEPKKKMYDKAGPRVAAALQKRNMEAYTVPPPLKRWRRCWS